MHCVKHKISYLKELNNSLLNKILKNYYSIPSKTSVNFISMKLTEFSFFKCYLKYVI